MKKNFEIELHDSYVLVRPLLAYMDVGLVREMRGEITKLAEQGHRNFVVDLQHCQQSDYSGVDQLDITKEMLYNKGYSVAFINVTKPVLDIMKADDVDLRINVVWRIEEAIEVFTMDGLEREMMADDDGFVADGFDGDDGDMGNDPAALLQEDGDMLEDDNMTGENTNDNSGGFDDNSGGSFDDNSGSSFDDD